MSGIFDDLDEMPPARADHGQVYAPASPTAEARVRVTVEHEGIHRERCKKCGGTGRFGTYRALGQCFACKGVGYVVYKTDSATRAKGRQQAQDRKTATADAWRAANPEAAAWILARAGSFDFALAMSEALTKYGHLTDGQLAAVHRMIAGDAERAARRAVEAVERAAAAPVVDISALETAMNAAAAAGKRVILRVAAFRFTFAKAESKNAGAIYVKDTAGNYLGKVQGGRVFRARECSPETEAAIVAAAADPKGAAIAYGREFGRCACCGKELSNAESIKLGIGPICATKFGW